MYGPPCSLCVGHCIWGVNRLKILMISFLFSGKFPWLPKWYVTMAEVFTSAALLKCWFGERQVGAQQVEVGTPHRVVTPIRTVLKSTIIPHLHIVTIVLHYFGVHSRWAFVSFLPWLVMYKLVSREVYSVTDFNQHIGMTKSGLLEI